MSRRISFHAVDVEFFDTVIEPLVAGGKVNPETYLAAALGLRRARWRVERYRRTLEQLLEQAEPPPPPEDGSLWDRVRTRLERFDHKPSMLVRTVARKIEPELHLHGRPYFITEGSADRVAGLVDEYRNATEPSRVDALVLEQLVRLDPELGRAVEPAETEELSPDGSYRGDLLRELKDLHEIGHAAREGLDWGRAGVDRRPGREVLEQELPWRAVRLHARAVPCWIGRNVDGLDTMTRAAGTPPPGFLVPPLRLFAGTIEAFPALRESLRVELQMTRSVGAFVPPQDVGELLDYLAAHGSRIIQVATQHGEGGAAKTVLRKIRECASYCARHGTGYLEASGIAWDDPGDEDL